MSTDEPKNLSPDDTLRAAGARALAKAIELFNLDVWDPPTRDKRVVAERWRDVISDLTGANYTGNGLGWWWLDRYAGDGEFEWCGAFAARCWQEGGIPVTMRMPFFASCYRLRRWASYLPIDNRNPNKRPHTAPHRMCIKLDESSESLPDGVVPRAGDILIVGGVGTGDGKHITIVERFDASGFHTYEGNARGTGPDGKPRQGIVRAVRPLGLPKNAAPTTYHARWLIRPAPGDLL